MRKFYWKDENVKEINELYVEELIDRDSILHFTLTGDFCCGADDPLNIFLSDQAFDYNDSKQGKTYLIMDAERTMIICYYTLKANAVHSFNITDNVFVALPVIEISRIAVECDFQGQSLGKIFFTDFILPKILEVAKIIGVYGIIAFVDADNYNAIRFYTSLGFQESNSTIQNAINDSFNEDCKLYLLIL